MPPFPIVDAHVHLWDPAQLRMDWVGDSEVLNRAYGPADYWSHTAGVAVEAFVYVEVDVAAPYGLVEARWAEAVARNEPRLQGIVAHAPLEDGQRVRLYLDALAQIGPRIKGVRRLLQGESDPTFCLRPGFVEGVQLLAEYGYSFDICVKHLQLGPVIELVRRCPQSSFVLDHIAKPDIAARLHSPWRAQMRALAALPNVVCKVSGVVTEANHASWTVEAITPYVSHALEVFGEDRVLFGGDWPVVLLASPYARWVEALDTLTASMPEAALRKLWNENARRVYRL
jgi:L-fuconolactonase